MQSADRPEIPTSCSVLSSLFRLDPVAKDEKRKGKIEIYIKRSRMLVVWLRAIIRVSLKMFMTKCHYF